MFSLEGASSNVGGNFFHVNFHQKLFVDAEIYERLAAFQPKVFSDGEVRAYCTPLPRRTPACPPTTPSPFGTRANVQKYKKNKKKQKEVTLKYPAVPLSLVCFLLPSVHTDERALRVSRRSDGLDHRGA